MKNSVLLDKIRRNWEQIIFWCFMFVYYIFIFKLVIHSGYMFDDMWSNVDKGLMIKHDDNIFRYVYTGMQKWLKVYGRVLFFSFYSDFVVAYVPLALYKLMIVLSMFFNGVVVSLIIKELTHSKRLTAFVMLLFPLTLSLKATYYTGVYGFHMLVQMCLMFTLLAVYFYIVYRRTSKVRYQVFSCIT